MATPTIPTYVPAPYLLEKSHLTTSQLVSHFQDFYASLEYISCAPALVFDRLVINLNDAYTATIQQRSLQHITALEKERLEHAAALERERLEHATALDKYRDENRALQSINDQLQSELAELKAISDPIIESSPNIGTFYTYEVRPLKELRKQTSKTVTFAHPYSTPPNLCVGLNLLNLPNSDVIRVNAHASDIQADRFNINLDTWCGTVLRAGGCTWLEVGTNDPDFQFGSFQTSDGYCGTLVTHYARQITFARIFSTPPKVVVWLKLLDMSSKSNLRVRAYEADVTATDFTIHIDTGADSQLHGVAASWIAYPADKPNISSGKFSTEEVRPAEHPQRYNSAYVDFGKTFTSPPRTLLALNSLNFSSKHDLRVVVKASDITATGMTWHLDTWDDSILYSAGASYIALGSP